MSQSTDGILFYGFPVEEGSEGHNILAGINEDTGDYIDEENSGDDDATWARMFGFNYATELEKVWRHREKYPVNIGTHCSIDCPMYFVAIRLSILTASRGYPEKIDNFTVGKSWDKDLREFCKLWKLTPPEKFAWYLVSD